MGFPVGAVEFGVAAAEDCRVGGVPLLDDLEAFVDFAAQVRMGEVVGDKGGADRAAEFFDGLVGGVFGSTAFESSQDLLGLSRTERLVRERMTMYDQSVDSITPQSAHK